FGLDNNYWSGIFGLDKVKEDFGMYGGTKGAWVLPPTGTGAPNAGLAVGCLAAGFAGSLIGRVQTFRCAVVISIVGVLLQATAGSSYWQIIVGRIVNSVALGIIINMVPVYHAECTPAKIRGTVRPPEPCARIVPKQISSSMFINSVYWHDVRASEGVVILQFIVPVVLESFGFILPEYPRWLIDKGRDSEALTVLKFLRRGTESHVVEQEAQILSAIEEQNRHNFKANSRMKYFKGTNLRRTLIATDVQCLQQAQGNAFIASYTVAFLQTIGMKDTYKTHILLVLTTTLSATFVFYFADCLGCCWPMIISAGYMGALMYLIAGITGNSVMGQPAAQKAALAMLFKWKSFLATGWNAYVWIVTAKVPTLQLREKMIMTATFTSFCVSIMVSFINPFMQDEGEGFFKGKVGFFYDSFSIVAVIWSFFMLPETGGRSLEELDELFEKKISIREFASYKIPGSGAMLEGRHEVKLIDEEGGIVGKGLEAIVGREVSGEESGLDIREKDKE
ncbi:general substrate transporter, partial [Amniculicola lignicola CBS 123094]